MVKNLRMLRLRKGISQQTLANYLNITQQSVYRYEKEKFEPDISTLMALADYFGTTVDFLIGHAAPSQDAPREELALAKEELALVRGYRRLSPEEKKSILLVVGNYLKSKDPPADC